MGFAAPMVFFKPGIGVVELRRSGGDFITLDTFLMRSVQDVTDTERAWALLERDTLNHEKLRKLEQILLEKSVNHLFDKDIVPRLPGVTSFSNQPSRWQLGQPSRSLFLFGPDALRSLLTSFAKRRWTCML